ncbi:RNA 2',3'-cyclic phosphodiesterase [Falsibacillus albus]|uniref:RNA 2',3'-cyclic phosphodiesterase n=1 Tax=Falsibacillus albus TaxID=2478915 RepID=A0A3L7K5F7_9BACI|nr:RNA 2',3'-cyclic phosphodiesterase [Falsibacillus albus]RLQ97885.1 RNA 2',3'-cyclic phosphodiesterase [Falsibacillus albus]
MNRPHFFLAIPLPPESKQFLKQWSNKLSNELPFKKWVHPEDVHITLAFLGVADEQRLEALKKSLDSLIRHHPVFSLAIDHLGVFGRKTAPRIFWAGVSAPDNLYSLQEVVKGAALSAGFELDEKPFNPHITLARKWSDSADFPVSFLEEQRETSHFLVDQIVLYETHMDRVPKYEIKASWQLDPTQRK